jgi:hypothetical protein
VKCKQDLKKKKAKSFHEIEKDINKEKKENKKESHYQDSTHAIRGDFVDFQVNFLAIQFVQIDFLTILQKILLAVWQQYIRRSLPVRYRGRKEVSKQASKQVSK